MIEAFCVFFAQGRLIPSQIAAIISKSGAGEHIFSQGWLESSRYTRVSSSSSDIWIQAIPPPTGGKLHPHTVVVPLAFSLVYIPACISKHIWHGRCIKVIAFSVHPRSPPVDFDDTFVPDSFSSPQAAMIHYLFVFYLRFEYTCMLSLLLVRWHIQVIKTKQRQVSDGKKSAHLLFSRSNPHGYGGTDSANK